MTITSLQLPGKTNISKTVLTREPYLLKSDKVFFSKNGLIESYASCDGMMQTAHNVVNRTHLNFPRDITNAMDGD